MATKTLATAASPTPLCILKLPPNLSDALCNPPGPLNRVLPPGAKLVWHMRHAQSTANVAKEKAKALDRKKAGFANERAANEDILLRDAPLTDVGLKQAEVTRDTVKKWAVTPTLVVCSPMTRAIQTAAIMFDVELRDGSAKLVIRPELREFSSRLQENMGSTLPELRKSPHLKKLARWADVEKALSPEATAGWADKWDTKWANGPEWKKHVDDGQRAVDIKAWITARPEKYIATVSHWATINNMMNREKWADGWKRTPVFEKLVPSAWPKAGLAKVFQVPM